MACRYSASTRVPKTQGEVTPVAPGRPWENGYVESFNGKMRDEVLNPEIFDTLLEARVLVERWRRDYNQIRPHSSLGYCPPARGGPPRAARAPSLRS